MILRLADRASSPAIAMMLLTEFHIKNGTMQQRVTARQIQQRWIDRARTHYSQFRRKETAQEKKFRENLNEQIAERKKLMNRVSRYAAKQRALAGIQ